MPPCPEPAASGPPPLVEDPVDAVNSQSTWILQPATQLLDHCPLLSNNIAGLQGSGDLSQLGMDTGFTSQQTDAFALNWLSPTIRSQFDWPGQVASFQTGGEDAFRHPSLPSNSPLASHSKTWPAPTYQLDVQQPAGVIETLDQASPSSCPSSQCQSIDVSASGNINATHHDRHHDVRVGTESISESSSTVATLYVEGGEARAPFRGRSIQQRSTSSVAGLATDDESPSVSPSSSQYTAAHSGSSSGPGVLSVRAYKNLVHSATAEASCHRIHSGQSAIQFPTHRQMQSFFQLYFRCFHPSFPFLRPDLAFYELSSNWLVTLALCAVGSRYCCEPEGSGAGKLLFDVFETIVCQALSDSTFESILGPWGAQIAMPERQEDSVLCIVQAAALKLICKAHDGGDHSAPSILLMERYKIVQACRNMGLLAADDVDKSPWPTEPASTRDPDTLVEAWLKEESRLRTGYITWVSAVPKS